ncbi:MAG TPA: PhzF family phenazine biosynthesis protein [Rudaea sp.]|jgi:PhzF family phenazine biosynthesis protein
MNCSAFKQVDVFTSERYRGNALAVILDADDLADADMQRIAAWTNLSETTFVLPPSRPGADYRVRIFTPRSELPFAGHPSVGTAHALLEARRIEASDHLVQECAAGLLPVRVVGEGPQRRVFVRAPRAQLHPSSDAITAAVTRALSCAPAGSHPPRVVNNGPDWLICDLGVEATVRELRPDMTALERLSAETGSIGISVFGRASGSDCQLVVRAFAPADGVPEDPVTGSANAAIGAYLLASGQLDAIGASYRVSQGREIGRDGYVDVCVDAASGDVEIGGCSVTSIDGMLALP